MKIFPNHILLMMNGIELMDMLVKKNIKNI